MQRKPVRPGDSRLRRAPNSALEAPKRTRRGESTSGYKLPRSTCSGGPDCIRSSAAQMGQDQISFKFPCSLKDSTCSTRLCVAHLAVGKPLRPLPSSSSIIFEVLPRFKALSLYLTITADGLNLRSSDECIGL